MTAKVERLLSDSGYDKSLDFNMFTFPGPELLKLTSAEFVHQCGVVKRQDGFPRDPASSQMGTSSLSVPNVSFALVFFSRQVSPAKKHRIHDTSFPLHEE
mmetsp:Transcript_27612/g.72776  ORF Transcript_27612/g.72776 Transcript_27612/m.72776 type:complete len:100 (-) Transcript_27612:255-554(-)